VKTLRESYPPRLKQGFVIFVTGLYNSGHDTVARALQTVFNEQGGRSTSLLLGDLTHQNNGSGNQNSCPVCLGSDFYVDHTLSREERYNHLQRVGFVASELARAGAAVIAAPFAPHEAGRQAVRKAVTHQGASGGNFFLIHVATPIEYCEKTDRRGVYARAREGILKGLSGVDEDFEVPKDANLTVDLTEHSIPQVVHSALFFCLLQ
jgi:sulfate adenylyltransferase